MNQSRLHPRNWPLRYKLVGAISTVVVAFAAFQLYYFPRQMNDAAVSRAQKQALLISEIVGSAIGPGLEFGADLGDYSSVQATLDRLKGSDITYVIAYDNNGSAVASINATAARAGGSAASDLKQAAVRLLGDTVRADTPLLGANGPIGQLTLGLSLTEVAAENRKAQLTGLAVAGGLFFVGLLLSLVFAQFIAAPIQTVKNAAVLMAMGDLSQQEIKVASRDEVGAMAEAFNSLVRAQRDVVRQIADTSHQLASAAAEIFAATQQQEAASQHQSAGMEEVSRTMDSLLQSAAHIAEVSQAVTKNAEKNRDNISDLAGKVGELGGHTRRITEILETIREIADRSDLLALNASIEATRAGEAGRGFALVASEMRRLAERVTASVEDVKGLVEDIREYGSSTVMATEDGRKIADHNSNSAQQISLVTQQQRTATEQVSAGMKEIADVLAQSAAATQQTRALAEELKAQAEELAQTVGRFHLETSAKPLSLAQTDSGLERAA